MPRFAVFNAAAVVAIEESWDGEKERDRAGVRTVRPINNRLNLLDPDISRLTLPRLADYMKQCSLARSRHQFTSQMLSLCNASQHL